MKSYQHLWSMTAIVSTLLVGNMAVGLVRAQQSAPAPAVVTAREFRLVNEQGQTTAKIFNAPDGPRVSLLNPEQQVQLELKIDGYRKPAISLFNESGKVRLQLTQVDYKGDSNAPQIQLFDAQEKLLGNFGINPNLKADLTLSGIGNQTSVLKPESLFFYGPGDTVRTALFSYDGKSPGLAFGRRDGRYVWTAPPKQTVRRK